MIKKFKLFFFFVLIFATFYFSNVLLIKKINTISVIKIFNSSELIGQITKKSLLETCNDKILEFNCHVFRQIGSRYPIHYTNHIHSIDYSSLKYSVTDKNLLNKLILKFLKYENLSRKNNKVKTTPQITKNLYIINFNKDFKLERLKVFIKKFENTQKKNLSKYLDKNEFVLKKLIKSKNKEDIINYQKLGFIVKIEMLKMKYGNMNYMINTYDNKVPGHLFIFFLTLFLTLIIFCLFWFIKKKLSNLYS
jgi:hypothetical protein